MQSGHSRETRRANPLTHGFANEYVWGSLGLKPLLTKSQDKQQDLMSLKLTHWGPGPRSVGYCHRDAGGFAASVYPWENA